LHGCGLKKTWHTHAQQDNESKAKDAQHSTIRKPKASTQYEKRRMNRQETVSPRRQRLASRGLKRLKRKMKVSRQRATK
jgi:hypothetical protein